MHVRLAQPRNRYCVTPVRRPLEKGSGVVLAPGPFFFFLIAILALCVSACRSDRQVGAEAIDVAWTLTPKASPAGIATLATLTVRDRAGRPVRGAKLQIEGFMSHPGMAPVIATVAERGDGVYEASLQFSMAGDWIVLVKGRLPDGRPIEHRIDVPNVQIE